MISPEPNQSSLLAAVEQNLQGADAEAQRTEAEPVQFLLGVARGVGQKDPHAEKAENADRQVDIEDVAPRVVLGQPAAEDRAEDGPGHHRDAPHRHRRSLPLRRIRC